MAWWWFSKASCTASAICSWAGRCSYPPIMLFSRNPPGPKIAAMVGCDVLLLLRGGSCRITVRYWRSKFTAIRGRMAFEVVRARLLFERYIDALGNRSTALFAGLLEIRFGCAFCQRACPIPGNHGLNL